MRHSIHLDDGHAMTRNAESEKSIGGRIDHSQTIALALLDVDTRPRDLWATNEPALTIDETTVRNLRHRSA